MNKLAWGLERAKCSRAAVIGAGNMGGGIAAQFANAGVHVELLDVPGTGLARNEPAQLGLEKQQASRAFMGATSVGLVRVGNTEDHLDRISEADWIVEAVIEDLTAKRALYKRIEPLLKPGAIISSNTSTILRSKLIEGRSKTFKDSFVISHFFNPPRRMELLELVGSENGATFSHAADIARFALGKTIVECRDTPGFIANRIGCAWISVAVVDAIRLGLGVEQADAVHAGLGTPKTGVFGLLDLIGIDVIPYIWGSLMTSLPDDDLINMYDLPALEIISKLIETSRFGRKTKAGFYRFTNDNNREVVDLRTGKYRSHNGFSASDLPGQGKDLNALLSDETYLGAYARSILANVAVYATSNADAIAPSLAEIDTAMQLGYAWRQGPIEILGGLTAKTQAVLSESCDVPVVHFAVPQLKKSRDADRINLAQLQNSPLASNAAASLWDIGDGLVCLEFRSKMNAIDGDVLNILSEGLNALEGSARGMLVGNPNASLYSAGANLSAIAALIEKNDWKALEDFVRRGQDLFVALSLAPKPSVAAIPGLALGGGCELAMFCTETVAHAEARLGLPEHLVGLIPAWGGGRRLLSRLNRTGNHALSDLTPRTIFQAMTANGPTGSAREASERGLLDCEQEFIMHRNDLLEAALQKLEFLTSGFSPNKPTTYLPLEMGLVADLVAPFREQHYVGELSEDDLRVIGSVAELLTGGCQEQKVRTIGEVEYSAFEREIFMKMARHPLTLRRIQYMLKTGKALRT
ncbi:3-hydroxyacyl-CoA dehydrogenase/enoyl-CoA hydratase family protein [Thalassovita taeanensis]|uniref:3-hydroxyacyl-CoA dehydrogenase n=1 Tax=Thalassovita taeanensis TaxID=657014 RepID=A0A1H9K4G6_9RHOB|nr:3-hydroxyacyl-CoA dehydrogenase/enoyl-CoA hydratase family protein [Thalassovita taeanensis]SEQ93793.1 3-hydroxyacyl-CoA dehydrogenase [Thalassovita taeanensis]